MKRLTTQFTLFIICPFCQLEKALRTKYGDDILFITATAGVLDFSSDEISAIKDFIRREKVKNVCFVNDVSCNFIKEAILNEKEFGLHAEQQLRKLVQNMNIKVNCVVSMDEMKKMVAGENVQEQAKYLASKKLFRQELSTLEINIHTLILNEKKQLIANLS